MGRVSDMAIGLQEDARDELLCEIDHWKERADEFEALLQQVVDEWAVQFSDENETIKTIRAFLEIKRQRATKHKARADEATGLLRDYVAAVDMSVWSNWDDVLREVNYKIRAFLEAKP